MIGNSPVSSLLILLFGDGSETLAIASRFPFRRLKVLCRVLRLSIRSPSRSGSRLARISSNASILFSISVFTFSAAAMIAATDDAVVVERTVLVEMHCCELYCSKLLLPANSSVFFSSNTSIAVAM